MNTTLLMGLGVVGIYAYSKLKKPTTATPAGQLSAGNLPASPAPIVTGSPTNSYPLQIGNTSGFVTPAPVSGASDFFTGVVGAAPAKPKDNAYFFNGLPARPEASAPSHLNNDGYGFAPGQTVYK